MDVEQIREYCLSKKGVTEELPFDDVTLAFKVMGKIFALVALDSDLSVNLKCNPSRALELRERYPAIRPGYHMNKKHWNTLYIDGSLSRGLITELIDHSYDMVVCGMSKKLRDKLLKPPGE
jgi:predicted DNA-binding protein (MmcQ/YjbR family)